MEAMCLTAFFGFLRCAERPPNFILLLRTSKIDQLHQGQFIQLSKINSSLCLYSSMSRYLSRSKPLLPSDLLFVDSSRSVISRHWFFSHLASLISKAGLPPQFYTPHSFRIGAGSNIGSQDSLREALHSHHEQLILRFASATYSMPEGFREIQGGTIDKNNRLLTIYGDLSEKEYELYVGNKTPTLERYENYS
ncbi:UNVERIFIED_CONTAM: hypothetical protein FKN15_069359 [Acipenser sinensis]